MAVLSIGQFLDDATQGAESRRKCPAVGHAQGEICYEIEGILLHPVTFRQITTARWYLILCNLEKCWDKWFSNLVVEKTFKFERSAFCKFDLKTLVTFLPRLEALRRS